MLSFRKGGTIATLLAGMGMHGKRKALKTPFNTIYPSLLCGFLDDLTVADNEATS